MNIITICWEMNLINIFWVFKNDRLGRNQLIFSLLGERIQRNGVKLIVLNSVFDFDNPEDKFMFGIQSLVSEYENQLRFNRMTLGKISTLRDNKWWGGPLPIGYKLDENNRLIEEKESSIIVKKIFKYYSESKI